MILQVQRWLSGRELVIVADSSFSCLELLSSVSKTPGVSMITRLRLDAALYEPAPSRLPNLGQVLINPQTQWSKATLSNWYGELERPVEITTGLAVWYHTGLPVRTRMRSSRREARRSVRVEREYHLPPLSVKSERAIFTALGFRKS